MNEGTLSSEEAAEYRTNISGWVCKTCRRFYGDDQTSERVARYCCEKDHPCGVDGCLNRAKKPYINCEPCMQKKDLERWLALEQIPWDGETPLVLDDDDKYFFDVEDLEQYLEENNLKLEGIRLVIAEEDSKPVFEMAEFVSDYVPDDNHDVALGSEKIDKYVNRWIERNVPVTWLPSKKRPTLASLKEFVKEPTV